MKSSKKLRETLKEIREFLDSTGNLEYFETIESSTLNQLRKNGSFLYLLVRMGYTPIELEQKLDLRVETIEQRILEELKIIDSVEGAYQQYKFLFEKVGGFPKIDLYKIYMRSSLKEKDFIIREGIEKNRFERIKELFDTKSVNIYEEEEKDKKTKSMKQGNKGGSCVRKRRTNCFQIIPLA